MDAELKDGKKKRVRRDEGKDFTISCPHPESVAALADVQVSSKWENDLVFGSLGTEPVWTQCALNSRSISLQYQADPTGLPPPTTHKQHEMKSYLMLLCGQMIEGRLGLKKIWQERKT